MKKRKVWRYTCEHCGKSNCSAPSIAKHERHCTANPQRVCRMCARVGDEQKPIAELMAAIRYASLQFLDMDFIERKIDNLRVLANNCPACILAALRQGKDPEDSLGGNDGFHFKTEAKEWIEDYRAACLTGMSGDAKFDRETWDELRAKRNEARTIQTP